MYSSELQSTQVGSFEAHLEQDVKLCWMANETGWMAWNRGSAVTWMGSLCDPPTWAAHHAVPQTPQLWPGTASCSCAAATCWHESLTIVSSGWCVLIFTSRLVILDVLSLIAFSCKSGCIAVTNSYCCFPDDINFGGIVQYHILV